MKGFGQYPAGEIDAGAAPVTAIKTQHSVLKATGHLKHWPPMCMHRMGCCTSWQLPYFL